MKRKLLALAGACAWLFAASVAAQQTESRIVGTVADANGGVLPGATVTVTATQTGAVRTGVTNESGRYTITNLGPGAYEVAIEMSGFAPAKNTLTLGVGETKPVDFALSLANLTEAVTVRGEAIQFWIRRRRELASTSHPKRSPVFRSTDVTSPTS